MKTTYDAAFDFVDVSKAYIQRMEQSKNLPAVLHELTNEQTACIESYLGKKLVVQDEITENFIYALKKVGKRITTKIIPQFQNVIIENQIDLCEADEKFEPKKDDKGNLIFTKESMKKRNLFQLQAGLKECDVEEFYANSIPDNLTLEEREAFIGFVIPPVNGKEKKLTHN